VVTALALGARAAFIGRPSQHGLAVGGEAGVARLLAELRAELVEAMVLTGCPDTRSAGGLVAASKAPDLREHAV